MPRRSRSRFPTRSGRCCKAERTRPTGAWLHASSAPETDGHPVAFHDDGHITAPAAELEHPRQRRGVLLHVLILECDAFVAVVVARRQGIGTAVLAEDQHHPSMV